MAVIIMKDRRVKTKKIHLLNPLSQVEVSKIAQDLNKRIQYEHLTVKEIEEFILGGDMIQSSETSMEDLNRFFIDNVTSMFKERDVDSASEVLEDRKSTRLNSSHANISYAVFCLKKKKTIYDLRF